MNVQVTLNQTFFSINLLMNYTLKQRIETTFFSWISFLLSQPEGAEQVRWATKNFGRFTSPGDIISMSDSYPAQVLTGWLACQMHNRKSHQGLLARQMNFPPLAIRFLLRKTSISTLLADRRFLLSVMFENALKSLSLSTLVETW